MLKIGIVGFGFMGRMHYHCWKALVDAQVTAVCDANPNIVEDTQKAQAGNIGGADTEIDFSGVDIYSDFDKMLSQGNLDAVSITLPTFLHAETSAQALAAGVHVLCEKPMALNVADCDAMIAAAQKSDKVLQIGHCIRFWPEYAKTKELIDSGEFGPVIAASFERLGSAPAWAWDNWFMDEQRSGGMILDLHIHDTDYVEHLFGMPAAVSSFAAKHPGGGLCHIATQYIYDDSRVVTAQGGWGMAPSFGFEMSFNIVLEKATIVYDCTRDPAFRVCPAEGEAFTPQVAPGDGYSREIAHFAELIQGKDVPAITTLEQSRDSIKIIEAEKESVRTGQKANLIV
ncbi:MAG: Gfo/Idh/MocA family oxidoreductase [Sedimentisphaerales bacterium]|nr:Gfo/Idh/MocA family oxidoreductase [Sedimentisphaerales bacterium]